MGQSLVKNYIHLVFSTKYRQPLIFPPVEQELHAYLGGLCNQIDCQVLAVGGYTDHIHILFDLSKKIPLMVAVQKIKGNSSKWIKNRFPDLQHFYWQDGYGAFSVNPRQVDVVIDYIKNQHAHHREKSFKAEYRASLMRNRIEFDERYVWD
jgi:REP element-mobilizing transposase RayT